MISVTLTSDLIKNRYNSHVILHLYIEYESKICRTEWEIKLQPLLKAIIKDLTSVTLTFDLLTSKSIGIILWSYCIYIWNIKAVSVKLMDISCYNQFSKIWLLWPWPLTSKIIDIILWSCSIYIWNMKAVSVKLKEISCYNQFSKIWPLWPWPLTFWP